MRLLLNGCEYSGTTTLAEALDRWGMDVMGLGMSIHDHFKLPDSKPHGDPLTDEEIRQFAALSPRMTEVIQRHNIYYHTPKEVPSKAGNGIIIGLHIDDAVYGPLYWDYGKKGMIGERAIISMHIEHDLMKFTPETVLVHVGADPDVIARRMEESTHPYPVVKERDIEHVLERFDEENWNSLLGNRIALDTSKATVAETVEEFAEKIVPYLTESDRAAMLLHQSKRAPSA